MTIPWRDRPIGVVGLGLIGGSLALDLRAQGLRVQALVHRQATAQRARLRGLADQVSTDPAVLAECALVVLALPLDRLLEPSSELLGALPAGAVITDVGSVKGPVLDRWGQWPRFVASHPMAGTAQAGVEAGLAGLFAGRPWVATPTDATDPEALAVVRGLAEAVDAQWIECQASDHDQAVALISHLPVLLGAALIEAAGPVPLARLLASSGFADTSRVGGGNPELGTLMARYNREALLAARARYRTSLDGLEQQVRAGDWPGVEQCLSQAQALRPEFL